MKISVFTLQFTFSSILSPLSSNTMLLTHSEYMHLIRNYSQFLPPSPMTFLSFILLTGETWSLADRCKELQISKSISMQKGFIGDPTQGRDGGLVKVDKVEGQ